MKRFVIFLVMIGYIFLSKPVFAYRPLGTEDAGVAGEGVAQMEISLDYLKWRGGDIEQIFLLVPIYGLSERLEVSTELPYLFHYPKDGDSQEGIGDINLVAKYLLIQETGRIPAFTAKGVVKLDHGDFEKGLGTGDKDYSLFAVASKGINNLTIHTHFGYTWVGNKSNKDMKNITLYGLAVDYGITENFHLLGEINGNRHPDIHEVNDPRNALIGITYIVSNRLALDMAYKWGISDAAPEWNTTAGMSITF